MGVCNCSMFYCMLFYVHSSIAIILMGKRELVALLILSSWCLVMVERLLLAVPWGCLWFVIVVFPDHAHLFFLKCTPSLTSFVSKIMEHIIHSSIMRFYDRHKIFHDCQRERSGSVVECLTLDRRAVGSSLTDVTAMWSLNKTHLS